MSRPLRIEYPGACYHVMNRGRRKEEIFQDDIDYEQFLNIMEQASRLFKIEIHAYSLMKNHYHLLLHTPLGNISRAMRHINGVYTQKYNKRHRLDGVLFRGRYKSIIIEDESYLLELVRYIHRNAVKARLVEIPGEYKWDSHSAYIKMNQKPVWLVTDEILFRFSKYEKEAGNRMNAFVNKEVPPELLKSLEDNKWPSMLGGDIFKEKLKKLIKGKKFDRSEVKGIGEYDEKKENENEIKKIITKKAEILKKRRSKKHSSERRAMIYLFRIYGKSLKEIGSYMGNISYVSVSRQYKQAEKEISKKKGCYKDLRGIVNALNLSYKYKTSYLTPHMTQHVVMTSLPDVDYEVVGTKLDKFEELITPILE
ncbi:transposase [Candidatus Desantisbacteria bacterium]|nr:transposase [Candidatus Desantisbacteria bacterium]